MILLILANNKFGFHCGGSLITNNHILTAAHCIEPYNLPQNWNLTKVRLGELDLATNFDCEKINQLYYCGHDPREINIFNSFIHENYKKTEQGDFNDIAIIQMAEFVEFTNFIKPICLPLNDEVQVEGSVIIAGFGRTENSRVSTRMMKTEIDVIDNNECMHRYAHQSRFIHGNQFCAAKFNSDSW